MTEQAWEEAHQKKEWGVYPSEHLVRFIKRNYAPSEFFEPHEVKFLDMGCGAGASAAFLLREGFDVDAMDISTTAVQRTITHLSQIDGIEETPVGDHWRVFRKSAQDLAGLKPDSYNCVIDICTLQHVEDLDAALANIHHVLKPGGKLFSIMASKDHVQGREPAGAFMRRFRYTEVRKEFELFFSDVKIDTTEYTDGLALIAHWIIEATKQ